MEAYSKLLQLRPDHAEAMCDLAVFYRADARTAEALELLEKAAVLDTNLAMAYSNLGQLYLALGRQEAAEKALQRFRALAGLAEETAVLLAEAEAHPWTQTHIYASPMPFRVKANRSAPNLTTFRLSNSTGL